jgi:uncharacterized repeat protein (TIGR03803 family)
MGCLSLARPAQAQTLSVIHSFAGHSEGSAPYAPLVQDAAGNLYGTTFDGGASGTTGCANDCGVAYALDSTGQETLLYSFDKTVGGKSQGGLIRDSKGNLYGTTQIGGDLNCGGGAGCGMVFKLDAAGTLTVLHTFEGPDGAHPQTALLRDTAGNFYGTTLEGGAVNRGTVFKIDTTGKETVLHSFRAKDGAWPFSGLIGDAQGNLYGTTEFGGGMTGACGTFGCGVVYQIDRSGHETVLYSFTGGADGSEGGSTLVRDGAGNLYGTTGFGGDLSCFAPYGCGVVFKLDSAGHETVLYSFQGQPDGWNPIAGLVRDPAGNFYGTTLRGGAYGAGTVFELDTTGKETVLYSFTGGSDGASPYAGLTRDSSNNLYGTAVGGGRGFGVVFKVTP